MFDTVTVRPRRKATLTISLGAHALLGALLFVGPLWAVPDPPDPGERFSAFQPPPAPAEPIHVTIERDRPHAPKGDPRGGRPEAAPRMTRPTDAQPAEISSTLPVPGDAPPEDLPAGDGPARSGDSLGAGPGLVDAPIGERDGSDILDANAPNVAPPIAIYQPDPLYPEAARIARLQGLVILEAVIGPDGTVRDARVLRSANPMLDRAASETVLRWRYRPARVGERTVAVYLTVTVRFGIR